MTPTVLLAAVAGLCAAVAAVDLAVLVAHRRAAKARGAARPLAGLIRLGRRLGITAAPASLAERLAAAGLGDGTEALAASRARARALGDAGGPPDDLLGAPPAPGVDLLEGAARRRAASGEARAGARGPTSGGGRGITVADAMAAKAGALVAAAAAVAPIAAALPGRLGLLVLALAGGAGFVAPDVWLRRRARQRGAAAGLELPDVLDLLRVAVGAGLPASRAMAEVAARRRGVVAAELRAAAGRIELGVPRGTALAQLQARLPLPEVAALVAAVARADRHGAPLEEALAALAAESRALRARRLHDRAARAAPRVQLVVALLLVPAVLLLVAASLVRDLT